MNRRIGLTVLAVVLGIVGAGAVYAYAQSANERAVESLEAVEVVVVQQRVPAGTAWSDAISGDYFQVEKVPASSAPSSAVGDLNADIPDGEVSTHTLRPGQVLVRSMFGSKTAATGALEIPGDLQAISIALTADAQVSGYVRSGSEVAIYQTAEVTGSPDAGNDQTTAGSEDKTFVTTLLEPRVGVLAVSRVAPGDVDGADEDDLQGGVQSSDDFLVTLAVSQQQAERIILAQQVGKLYVGLLSETSVTEPGDGVVNRGVLEPDLLYPN